MLAVTRTMELLNALSKRSEPVGVLDLAHSLDIHKADVSRILSTLEDGGYVIQDESTSKYTLSLKFVAMALKFRDETRMEDMVRPVLKDLVRATGESVQFAVQQGQDLVYVEKEEGIKALRVASMLGQTAPLHATAVGKVWLASLDRDRAMELLKARGMRAITPHTITDMDEFMTQLEIVRKQGFSVAREEINPNVFALAAPVYDRKEKVRGALVITLPIYEATEERVASVKSEVLRHAALLTERMQMFW